MKRKLIGWSFIALAGIGALLYSKWDRATPPRGTASTPPAVPVGPAVGTSVAMKDLITLHAPVDDAEIQADSDRLAEASFRWTLDKAADQVVFELRKDWGSKRLLKRVIVTGTEELSLRFKTDGRYRWLLRATDSSTGRATESSAFFRIHHLDRRATHHLAARKASEPRRPTALDEALTIHLEPKPEWPVPLDPRRAWIQLGTGANYIRFQQTMGTEPTVDYATTVGPSIAVRGGFLSGDFGFEASFSRSPGRIKTADVSISNTEFVWQTTSMDALYRFLDDRRRAGGWEGLLRFGLQAHELPYLTVNNGGLVLGQYDLLAASIGGEFLRDLSPQWRARILMRYQQSFSSNDHGGSHFKTSSPFGFDGSVGVERTWPAGLTMGLFWYGQMQRAHYSLIQGNGTADGGDQSLFFSNLELRLGREF